MSNNEITIKYGSYFYKIESKEPSDILKYLVKFYNIYINGYEQDGIKYPGSFIPIPQYKNEDVIETLANFIVVFFDNLTTNPNNDGFYYFGDELAIYYYILISTYMMFLPNKVQITKSIQVRLSEIQRQINQYYRVNLLANQINKVILYERFNETSNLALVCFQNVSKKLKIPVRDFIPLAKSYCIINFPYYEYQMYLLIKNKNMIFGIVLTNLILYRLSYQKFKRLKSDAISTSTENNLTSNVKLKLPFKVVAEYNSTMTLYDFLKSQIGIILTERLFMGVIQPAIINRYFIIKKGEFYYQLVSKNNIISTELIK